MNRLRIAVLVCAIGVAGAVAAHGATRPTIYSYTADRTQVDYLSVEEGVEAVNMTWRASGLGSNHHMRMEAWVGGRWVLIGEGFAPIKTDRIVVSHPLSFDPPHYRLTINDRDGRVVREKHLYLDYAPSGQAETPTIERFMVDTAAPILRADLAEGQATVPVSWKVIDRGHAHQLTFAQLIGSSGEFLLPPDEWQPRQGSASLTLHPTDSSTLFLRLSVVDRITQETITEGIITLPVLDAAPMLSAIDSTVQLDDNVLATVRRLQAIGQERGNNPDEMIRVGDSNLADEAVLCNLQWGNYDMGAATDLQATIDRFSPSFCRDSIGAGRGFSTMALLDPFWASDAACQPNETPLDCTLRVNRPSYALVYIGVLDIAHSTADAEQTITTYEANLNTILDSLTDNGVVPIVSTFPTGLSFGDDETVKAFNTIIRDAATTRQLPLIDLRDMTTHYPNRGVNVDGFHMSSPPDGRTSFTGNEQIYARTLYEWLVLETLQKLQSQDMNTLTD